MAILLDKRGGRTLNQEELRSEVRSIYKSNDEIKEKPMALKVRLKMAIQ